MLHDTLPLVLVVDDEARSLDAIRRNLEEDFRVLYGGQRRRGARPAGAARGQRDPV